MNETSTDNSLASRGAEILRLTNDGNRLVGGDLHLLQEAVNSNLNEKGLEAFDKLYRDVKSGAYFVDHKWFHGIEHMTAEHSGYVYWRGKEVEHYTHPWSTEAKEAAERLAARCRHLEKLGVEPTTSTAVWRWNWYQGLTALPARMPVALALYDATEHADGRTLVHLGIQFDHEEPLTFISAVREKVGGGFAWRLLDPRDASPQDRLLCNYHKAQALGFQSVARMLGAPEHQGLTSAPIENVLAWIEKVELSDEVIDKARAKADTATAPHVPVRAKPRHTPSP